MEKRIRRVRAVREPAPARGIRIPEADRRKMDDLLQSIADAEHEIAVKTATKAEDEAELFKLMRTYKMDKLSIEDATAEVVTPTGRSSSVIDAREFHDLVEEDDFYACIDVVKNRAEKVLSTRELEKITETTPGKKGDPKLVVKRR